MRLLGFALLASAFLAACSSGNDLSRPRPAPLSAGATEITGTGQLDVGAMEPALAATSDGDEITVTASLLYGTRFLHVDPGDALTATVGDLELLMSEEPHADDTIRYSVRFPARRDAIDVKVAFERSGRPGAPSSVVHLLPAFDLASTTPAVVHPGEPLSFAVSVPSDQTTIAATGPCLEPMLPVAVPDVAGAFVFDTTKLALKPGSSGCDVRIDVRHESHGQVDAAWKRGAQGAVAVMEGAQVRSLATHLAPAP